MVTTEQLCYELAASPSLVRLKSARDSGRNYCIRKVPSIQKNKKKLLYVVANEAGGRPRDQGPTLHSRLTAMGKEVEE